MMLERQQAAPEHTEIRDQIFSNSVDFTDGTFASGNPGNRPTGPLAMTTEATSTRMALVDRARLDRKLDSTSGASTDELALLATTGPLHKQDKGGDIGTI
jgi:hypothetical protein